MYLGQLKKLLDENGISVGDMIEVCFKGVSKKGTLMPKNDFSGSKTITLKLRNGYNIGISIDVLETIKKIEGWKENDDSNRTKKSELFDKNKPKISMINTGGTIASRIDYRTGGVYALSTAEDILGNIPELADIAHIRGVAPFTKMSEDMDPLDWIKIAKEVAKELNNENRGVIITHGTDFLHYTSAALSFMLGNPGKPVILVGSQRSSDRASSDAAMNIICAAHAATGNIAGVNICMHGETNDSFCLLNRGTKVRKMHTSRRDAFRPINDLPIAKIWPDGKIEIINSNHRKRDDSPIVADVKFEPNVAILRVYPGADPGVIDYYVDKGYKGFVIETSGLGHVPTFARKSWIDAIRKYTKDGIPFVGTAQTIYGRLHSSVYTNLRILYHDGGAICGGDMLTETAYAKLGWILGHTQNIEEIKRLMLTDFAGEITKRSLPETYLY
ncbi:MAG: Glu-tRNA(Gln) amidotransferase subunit GatD [Candidatus Micrarchaeota archaeon]|nr:Glu-tRNA(Gln) amidotransferase subunit GatD [Candidatus Micrarchaeota archaeon]